MNSNSLYIKKKIIKFLPFKNDLPVVAILILVISLFLIPASYEKDFCCDFMGQPVPWYHYLNLSLKQGILPFWSPYAYLGLPFLFTPTLAFFHPFTLLIVLLNLLFNSQQVSIGVTGQIIEFVVILSICVGGVGMYVLCRRIFDFSKLTALFVGIVFSLNPYRLYDMQSLFVDWAISSLPWIFLSLILFLAKPTFRLFFLLTFLNFLVVAAGYPYYYVYIFAAELLLVVFYGRKKLALFILSLVNSLLLSGFFLLPYLHVLLNAGRSKGDFGFYFHSFASYFPSTILQILNPLAFNVGLNYPNTTMIFPGPTLTWGTFVLIFLIYGLFSIKNKPIYKWIIILFFISLLYSFGSNLSSHSFFGTLMPIIYKFRTHARILHITLFAGALLIGLGIEMISKKLRMKYIDISFWFICISFFIALTLAPIFLWDKIAATVDVFRGTVIMFLFLFMSLVVTTLTLKYGKKIFLILGLIIMLIEYHHYYTNINGVFMEENESYSRFYQQNPTIIEQPSNDSLFRVFFENSFTYNSAIISQYGLQGYESNIPNAYGHLMQIYGFSPHFWQVANVKYIITPQNDFGINKPELVKVKTVNPADYPEQFSVAEHVTPYDIYEVKGYLPRFYVPQKVTPCLDEKCWKKEDAPKLVLAKGISTPIINPKEDTRISVHTYTPNNVELEVETPGKTFIASSETYDKGWSLTVNSRPSQFYYISNGLRGFIVSAGNSVVKMSYFPAYFKEGIMLSIIGIVLLSIIYYFSKRHNFFKV